MNSLHEECCVESCDDEEIKECCKGNVNFNTQIGEIGCSEVGQEVQLVVCNLAIAAAMCVFTGGTSCAATFAKEVAVALIDMLKEKITDQIDDIKEAFLDGIGLTALKTQFQDNLIVITASLLDKMGAFACRRSAADPRRFDLLRISRSSIVFCCFPPVPRDLQGRQRRK